MHFSFTVFSSSVPSNIPHVGLNSNTEQNNVSNNNNTFEFVEFISSDFSCTSSIDSSRSGMGELKASVLNAFFNNFEI